MKTLRDFLVQRRDRRTGWRRVGFGALGLAALLSALAVLGVAAAPNPVANAQGQGPDFAIPNGWFYTQTGGAAGRGYSVVDDGSARLWSEFQRRGGVAGVGYPVSQRFVWDGFTSQAFQKMILQWRVDRGRAEVVNTVDLLHDRGFDGWLATVRATPPIADWSADTGKAWPDVMAAHQALLTDDAIRAVYLAAADPLELYGLPMAPIQDRGNVLVLRTQRGILQKWLTDVPWAAAGQVTVANSGDLAKEAGLLPAAALVAESRGPQTGIPMAVARFERGHMIWRGDTKQIYVLLDSGSYQAYPDPYVSGQPESTGLTPPTGLLEPVRGFGRVWNERPDVRAQLGWQVAPEIGVAGSVTEEGGQTTLDTQGLGRWVLRPNGTYEKTR